jgi:hypothetical protein
LEALVKRIKLEALAQLDDTDNFFTVYRDALTILTDIVTTTEQHRPLNSTAVHVGHFVHQGIRITGRILGPLRTDGGLFLVTRQGPDDNTRHQICRLDSLFQDSRDDLEHREFLTKLQVLIEKAVCARDGARTEATNYFSGGKVVKSI